ncbi:MAG: HAD family hydrolase [Deltaproteobacteria bacterium]|nr:HAD family hydrolase [Deltaproteobacteria bacterium]
MPNAPPLRAVVFDLDDTLYLERDYVRSGFRAVSRWAQEALAVDAARVFAELWQAFEQGARGDTFDRWLRSQGLKVGEHLPAMLRAYREHAPSIRPLPGAPALLERLHRRLRTGLISDGQAAVQRRKLSALGLARHLDAVVLTDELGREFWKPHPRAFEEMVERLGVEPASTVYVADNCAKDFLGARQVGLRTIRVRHAGAEHCLRDPPTEQHAPEATVEGLEALTPGPSLLAGVERGGLV